MRKASLGTIFLTVFLDLLGFGLVIPFLPGFARQLGASDFVATLTGAVYSLMQFLLVPVWGRLSDRIGRRPVLLASIAATAAGMVLLGFANTLVLLFAARLWSGMATANIAVAQAYIADVTPPEGRARGMGLIGLAFGLGFIFGPFVGGELARVPIMGRAGALPAFVAAGLSVVNLVLAATLLPESLAPESRGKPERPPSNAAGLRRYAPGARPPRHRPRAGHQLPVGLLVRRHGTDLSAVHRRRVPHVGRGNGPRVGPGRSRRRGGSGRSHRPAFAPFRRGSFAGGGVDVPDGGVRPAGHIAARHARPPGGPERGLRAHRDW